ncbi:chromosome segregation protein SMC [Pseudolabrys sp. Root1462]|uniref:chromosome segregation SMC family protein n=1 Tax=Pseudolabrys sp. Root1462 TaxID=1736466 RepID=UPI000703AED2|nr:AAA family ATPase [Pseudolabrys sp. Root1462]KQZ01844.1 chromosome segregation protein SMC [Pseudolabrys sp. Root1462]
MILTRLRLLGFKTFVEPTDFVIEPGLTGVVGPNGCGKSNLVEALRWVMGENSYKSMRASSMDDVIFSGSNTRPARNNAEVAIMIDNKERSAPAQFNDTDTLEIARRIEREEGSSYRINGKEVRARDVQIVFADASTGARSPALVHQGRIGEIIQAKPEQRRRVLEEAAGVSGLHARRHEAELRLKAAEANLTRLEDVIGQLAGQMEALKKQAKQAIRYRTVSAQVRKTEATLYHLRWSAANIEQTEAETAKDLCVREVAARTGAQAEASTRQTELAATLPPLREAEARAGAALHRLNVAMQELEREEQRAKDRISELDKRLVQLAADSEREQKLVADADAAIARLAEEEEMIKAEAAESAGRRSGVDARVEEASSTLAAAEKVFSELTARLADLTARRNQLEAAMRQHRERATKIEAEVAEVTREIEALQASAGPDLAALTQEVEDIQQALASAENAAIDAEAAHAAARAALEASRNPLAEAERRVQRLETEAKTLSKVLAVESKNLWPPVMDNITVDKGYEKALGAALGDDLDAPIDPSAPMRWVGSVVDAGDPRLPDGATPLSAHVRAPDELTRRLNQIGVVDKESGARLVAQLKPGQRLVSPEGDLWRWDGFAAAAHAPTGAARRLAERARLAEIETELQVAKADAESARRDSEVAQAALSAAATAETEARNAARERQRDVNAARDRHEAAEREVNRNAARLSALTEAQSRLTASHDEATAGIAEAEQALSELAPAAELETELDGVRDDIAGKRAHLAEVRAEQQAIVREAEIADRRLRQVGEEKAGWFTRQESARGQTETLSQRIQEAQRDRTELENAPQIFAEKRDALISEVQLAETDRQDCADRLQAAENALAEADRDARAALEAASTAREELARAEERFEASKRRLTDIAREIHDMLEVEPEGVAALAELTEGEALPDLAEIEATLERLRRERERLGAVNLRAEEELVEVETQHTSLTTERDDLVEAIKKLRLGIQSLNREARERLMASFQQVNTHFQQLFTKLFNGGTAELQLIESDDPLEAGLEILAKPPGKKPATLSLLSGGEQALTAMALIFAVFLTNPAPICVLDEVDAPLDDHNVERFCDMLDEMTQSTDTRFVIITHNPITMARMNRLFGVTMAERGVSQLVSVDLEAAVRFREAG